MHLYETAGKDATARVTFNAALLGAPAGALEVDLLERAAPAATATAGKDGFTVRVPAHGIAAVKLTYPR